ncbi:septum formation protein Maf [Candidatus Peregrinibacteria bacterium]|jgi:septum formation protein|nr:septum formation protein Maf [Candidatus Peregrinibacteria bacterium]
MLILASQSPRRRDLLNSIGVEFEIIVSNYEEDHDIETVPELLAKAHAINKAEEVYGRTKERVGDIILGSDTLVYLSGEILGKPRDAAQAKEMIQRLSGKIHQVITAMHFIVIENFEKSLTHIEKTDVTFKSLTNEEIDAYIETEEWQDKAGAYAIQGAAASFVAKIEGSFSNVVGLPLESFQRIYAELLND